MDGVSFDELERVLASARAPVAPAEAHGTLCGALCGRAAYGVEDWLREVLPDAAAPPGTAGRAALNAVFDATAQALGGQSMEFEPLLPDDESDLADRVEALAEWCSAFLYGLGAGSLPSLDEVPGEIGEVLRDFGEIGRAALGEGETLEANEAAYAELVEFVRAGTQLVYEELARHREQDLPADDGVH